MDLQFNQLLMLKKNLFLWDIFYIMNPSQKMI